MVTFKIILRRTKTLLWTAFSIIVILMAVTVGVGKLLMPYSDRYQPRLEAWLSEEFGRPATIDSFEGDWAAFGPRLTLRGLQLSSTDSISGEQASEVAIESAALDIKPWNLLMPGRPLYNFRVIGAHFDLIRSPGGQLRLSGFGVSRRAGGGERSALGDLARVGEVVLQDSSLSYLDEGHDIRIGLDDINGRLHLEGGEFSTEVNANLLDERSGLVFGEVDATLLISLDDGGVMQKASWHAKTREILLAAFQGKLPPNPFLPLTGWLNAELWGEWSGGAGHQINGVADLRDALLVNEHQDLHLEHLNTRFRWRFKEKGNWNLHLADFIFDQDDVSWTTPRLSLARHTADDIGLWISADELPLGVPLSLARDIMSIYGTKWPKALPQSADGQVSELDLALDNAWRLRLAVGRIENASVTGWDRWPDLQGLDGEVDLGKGFGTVRLASEQLRLDWPRMFREPLEMTIPGCNADVGWGDQWQVTITDCSVENDDLAAEGGLLLGEDEGKPWIDANFALTRGQIGRLSPYWPEAVMKQNVKAWLRRGLVGGEIIGGRFLMRGDLDDFPFRDGSGRFEAVAEVADATLDYLDGWPAASRVNAVARFVGPGMSVNGEVLDIAGVAVAAASAEIADFKQPLLEIDYRANSDLPGLLGFIRQTPLNEQIGVDLGQFEFSGPASTRGRITAPLGETPGELEVDGRVEIADGRFSDPARDIVIEGISGELSYDQRGFQGNALQALYAGHASSLDLSADADGREKFRAQLTGAYDVEEIIPGFLLEDFQVLSHISGNSVWRIALVVDSGADEGAREVALRINSDLVGVDMSLPQPLAKPAAAAWPLAVNFPLGEGAGPLDVVFENRAALRFDLGGADGGLRRALFRLDGQLAKLPDPGWIRVEGRAARLDLDGWTDVVIGEILQGSGMGALELEPGNLEASETLFLDRLFTDVGMQFSVEDEHFKAVFRSESLDGELRFRPGSAGSSSLTAEFERLVLGDPVSTGMQMETDPSGLPALHLYARSFSYAGVELGETRIEAYPTADGFHFEKVDASSDSLSVQASGDWSLGPEGPRSDFTIHMTSESLGDFLHSMEISSSMQGGQTLVDFDAWWPGSPGAFALSRLNGQVEFSVVDGNITGASAGGGRLLGLLSVQALPKRLSLDFRDVFDSGFSFDEAAGTFTMENGIARTDDVLLKSSAASISVSGSTDLVERRYDQLLTIRPGVGNTLPIIGALAAGPPGAAAGLALQGLLHNQLAEATQVRYLITGSWDEPIFEPVEVERAEADG